MAQTFYATSSGVAFALLGLWWVVVTQRYDDWEARKSRRRQAYTVSLYFMVPAMMSLLSLVSPGESTIWRVGFGFSGAIGLVEIAIALAENIRERAELLVRVLVAATVPLYIGVVAVAIRPQLAQDLNIDLTALETEAIFASLLLFVGVNFAWAMFFERKPDRPST
jgi:hypothetical protein